MRSTLFYRYLYATLKEKCVRRFNLAGKSLHMLWAAFALSAFTTSTLGADLDNGGYVEGEIAIAQEVDTWTFDGNAGDVISINVSDYNSSALAPRVKVFNPGGTLLAEGLDYTVTRFANLTLPSNGTYTVTIQDGDVSNDNGVNDTGSYRIYLVNAPVSEHGELVNGGYVEETIEVGDIDSWHFEGVAGHVISLHAVDVNGAIFAPLVQIFGPDGALLTSAFDYTVSRIGDFTLPVDGTYTVVIQDGDSANDYAFADTGDYRIYLMSVPVSEHGELVNGGYVEETIEVGDIDSWHFEGVAGHVISLHAVDVDGAIFAPLIQIFGPDGALLTSAFDYTVSRIGNLTLPTDGNYTVVVQDGDSANDYTYADTGDYRIYLMSVPVSEHGELVNGGYIEETIELGDIDTWHFEGTTGEIISLHAVDVDGTIFAPLVQIFGPDGALLTSAFDYTVSRIGDFTLPSDGTYTVVIQDGDSANDYTYADTGDYRIYLMSVPVSEHGELVNGGYVEETIELGDIDSWHFEGVAGHVISLHAVDVDGAIFSPLVQIFGPDGALLTSAFDYTVSRIGNLTLPADGTYTVVIQDGDSANDYTYADTGDYRIYLMSVPVSEHGELVNGGYVEETIELGDIDTWHFEGTTGEIISLHAVDVDGTIFAPLVQIFGPDGALLTSAFDYTVSRIGDFALPANGTYTVVIQDGDSANDYTYADTGDYRIYLMSVPVSEHGELVNGDYVEETIELGDIDTWHFEGTTGDIISLHAVDVGGEIFAPLVQVFRPDGTLLTSAFDYTVSRIGNFALPADGTYTVVIYDGDSANDYTYADTGDYRIYFLNPPVNEHGYLVENGYVEEFVDTGDMDAWQFYANSGDTVSIEVSKTEVASLAPYAVLYSPSGAIVSQAVDYSIANIVDLTLLETGEYTLVVLDGDVSNDFAYADTGPYQIGFNLEPGAPQPVPPSASISTNGNVYRFDTISLDGSGSTDPDNAPAPLTYYWAITEIPADSDLVLNMLDNVTGDSASIVPDVSGEYVFSLTVDDGLFTDSTEVTVTVMNRAPVAEAGTDGEFATGSVVTLDGSNSYDPEGDTLTYSWSFISKPSGSYAGIDSSASVITSFTADIEGTYVIALVVNDGETDSVADTVTLTVVNENVAPVALSSLPLEVLVGETIVLYGNDSYDPDNGPSPLSYAWSFGSIPAASGLTDADITNPGLATASFVPDIDGNFTVWLTVNDGELENSIAATTLVGALPVCSLNSEAGFDTTAGPGEVVQLDGTGSTYTSACDELSVNWQFVSVPSGSVLNNNDIASSGTLAASFMPDTSGAYVLRLTLVNGQISSADNVTVTVVANESPVAIAGADQTHDVQSNIVLDGSASYDPDASPAPLTYLWQVVSQPAGSNIQVTTPTAPVAGFFALLPGDYVLSLTVSDGSASDTDEILITIEAEEPLMCDINGDNVVDTTDIMKIFARRNTQANGPDDPADLNGDGVINVLDARGCVLQCTFTNCAVQPPQ